MLEIIKKNLKYLILLNFLALALSVYLFNNSVNYYQIKFKINSSDIVLKLNQIDQIFFNDYTFFSNKDTMHNFEESKSLINFYKESIISLFSNKDNWKIDNYDENFYIELFESSAVILKTKKIDYDHISMKTNDINETMKYMRDLNIKLKKYFEMNLKESFINIILNKKSFLKEYAATVHKNNIETIKSNLLELESYIKIFDHNSNDIKTGNIGIISNNIVSNQIDIINLEFGSLLSIYYNYDKEIFIKYKEIIKNFLEADYSNQLLQLSLRNKYGFLETMAKYDRFIDLFEKQEFAINGELFDFDRPIIEVEGFSNKHKSILVIMLGLFLSLLFLSTNFVINYKKSN